MCQELTEKVVAILDNVIEKKGKATLLLSGGSTPYPLYELIAKSHLDFSKIKIGLVDERWVHISHISSNEAMIRKAFSSVKDIQIVGMVSNLLEIEKNTNEIGILYQDFLHADIAIIGMGEDGHFASLFPFDENSNKGILDNTPRIIHTLAPTEPKNRISCNLAFLKTAHNKVLMLTGSSKMNVFLNSEKEKTPIYFFKEFLNFIYYSK